MKLINLFLFATLCMCVCSSCERLSDTETQTLLVDKTEYDVGPDGGTIEIAVQANVEFEVKSEADWIRYAQTKALDSKTVVLVVEKNSGEARNGEVTISQKGGLLNTTVKVSQESDIVDLGLSVKWRLRNLGATRPEEYGDYYAWGEIETKENYSWSIYKWGQGDYDKLTKYCPADGKDFWAGAGIPDEKSILDPEDDAAHVVLGGNWRVPTDEEWTELRTQCTWTWTTRNGVKGCLVISNKNGNSIFLPAAGVWNDTYLKDVGSSGNYWSSSLNTAIPHSARDVCFGSDVFRRGYNSRAWGESVRPVTE